MLLESKRVRSALSTPVVAASGLEASRISPPASYSASFNPFPAIIVGTTGIAMSAHAQTFAFQGKSSRNLLRDRALTLRTCSGRSRPLGSSPRRLRCIPLPHLLLRLAPATSLNPPISSSDRGTRVADAYLWWSRLHAEHRTSHIRCDEARL